MNHEPPPPSVRTRRQIRGWPDPEGTGRRVVGWGLVGLAVAAVALLAVAALVVAATARTLGRAFGHF